MAVVADTDEFFDNDNVPAKEQRGEEKKDDDSESGFADFMNFMTNSESGAKAPPPTTTQPSSSNKIEFTTSAKSTNKQPTADNDGSNNDNGDDNNTPLRKRSSCESIGDKVDESISGWFYGIGNFACNRSKTTIALSLVIAIACALGIAKLNTENRPEKVSRI